MTICVALPTGLCARPMPGASVQRLAAVALRCTAPASGSSGTRAI